MYMIVEICKEVAVRCDGLAAAGAPSLRIGPGRRSQTTGRWVALAQISLGPAPAVGGGSAPIATGWQALATASGGVQWGRSTTGARPSSPSTGNGR